MKKELVGTNAIILANRFNPSVTNQAWLVRNEIVEEQQIQSGGVFTDGIAQLNSDQFSLLVVPNHLQFTPFVDANLQQDLIVRKLGKIVESLPHTPFHALGLNFSWHVWKRERSDVAALTVEMLGKNAGRFQEQFHDDSALFGAYMSMDYEGFRLKLEIKPIETVDDELRIQFAFNFHRNLESVDSPASTISGMLTRWDVCHAKARGIIEKGLST